jgi:hypothetical protein
VYELINLHLFRWCFFFLVFWVFGGESPTPLLFLGEKIYQSSTIFFFFFLTLVVVVMMRRRRRRMSMMIWWSRLLLRLQLQRLEWLARASEAGTQSAFVPLSLGLLPAAGHDGVRHGAWYEAPGEACNGEGEKNQWQQVGRVFGLNEHSAQQQATAQTHNNTQRQSQTAPPPMTPGG